MKQDVGDQIQNRSLFKQGRSSSIAALIVKNCQAYLGRFIQAAWTNFGFNVEEYNILITLLKIMKM